MRTALWLVATLLLSGCAGAASPTTGGSTSPGPAGSTHEQDPSADTGTILVQVMTEELLPVDKAQVVLDKTDHAAFTDIAGVARFDALDPGAYTVLAAKPGYQSKQEKGKIVDVIAGEIAEAKLLLEPEQILDKSNFYQSTFPFTGFITCSVQVNPTAAQTCGRQTLLADPNGASLHRWTTDSLLVQTVVLEASWQPTFGAVPFELEFKAHRSRSCSATACSLSDQMFSAKGGSPLYFAAREDATGNLTRRLGDDPTKYPREHFAEMIVYCPSGGVCPASLVVQQKYDAWVTLFYGEQAPQGWSIIPKQ